MLTTEQKQVRLTGIGGSDAGVIAGLVPKKTPVQLWQQKTGRIPEEDLSDNELVEWGLELEEIIGKVWARRQSKRMGKEVKIRRNKQTLRSATNPFMLAHIDFEVVGWNEGLECKNAAWWMRDFWGEEQSDDVPLYYLTQGVHYMHVRNRPAWNFGVLIGGNELRSYHVTRDMDAEKQLIELERKFWTCVETDVAPPPIKVEDLVRINPSVSGSIPADEDVIVAVAEYNRVKAEIKERDARCDEIKLAVGRYMGDKSELVDPFDESITIATYRSHNETRVDTKRVKGTLAEDIALCLRAAMRDPAVDEATQNELVKLGPEGVAEKLVASCLKTSPVKKFLPK